MISPYVYYYNNSVRCIDLDGRYGLDGYYWTVYAMAVSMGLSINAIEFVLHAENYDNVVSNVASIQDTLWIISNEKAYNYNKWFAKISKNESSKTLYRINRC